MGRRYRFGAAGLALTLLVVVLCLFIPGVLLDFEGEQDVGEITQADQVYYADNVSTDDSIDFDFSTRVMMMEGKWKCDQKEISFSEASGTILEESAAAAFCSDTCWFFTWELWEQLPQLLDINLMAYVLTDKQRAYLQAVTQSGSESSASAEISIVPLSSAEEAAPEGQENQTAAVDGEMPYKVQDQVLNGDIRLYEFKETVLGTYYFYAWEYSVTDELLGIDIQMMIDAVTLDVYRIKIGGELFDGLPWGEALRYYGLALPYTISEAINNITEVRNNQVYIGSLWVPLAWVCDYYRMAERGMGGALNIEPPGLKQQENVNLMRLGTGQNGYTFYGGNFFANKIVFFEINYADAFGRFRNSRGSLVYMGFRSGADEFLWEASTSGIAF